MSQSGTFNSNSTSGTVTSISAGSGITLTPNPITSTGTVAVTAPVTIALGGSNATSFTQSNGIVTYNGTSLVNYAGPRINSSGYATNTSQPSFSAYLGSNVVNTTGAGLVYTLGQNLTPLTILFDQTSSMNTNGTFTAPVAGKYFFTLNILFLNATTANLVEIEFNATGDIKRTFNFGVANTALGAGAIGSTATALIAMALNDTITFNIYAAGEAGNTLTAQGVQGNTWVAGYLIC